jgi:hypothetical protein
MARTASLGAGLRAVLTVAVLAGCKARDPAAVGLLDEAAPEAAGDGAAEARAPAERTVICRALDDDGAPTAAPIVYRLIVKDRGAGDEAELPLAVTVVRLGAPAQATVVRDEAAVGSLEPAGELVLGFASGTLTADLLPAAERGAGSASGEDARGTHVGVLTLAADPGAQALRVGCWLADPG